MAPQPHCTHTYTHKIEKIRKNTHTQTLNTVIGSQRTPWNSAHPNKMLVNGRKQCEDSPKMERECISKILAGSHIDNSSKKKHTNMTFSSFQFSHCMLVYAWAANLCVCGTVLVELALYLYMKYISVEMKNGPRRGQCPNFAPHNSVLHAHHILLFFFFHFVLGHYKFGHL